MRVELNKDLVGHDPPADIVNLLKGLSGSFLEIDGGVGVISEYLSKLGNDVTLQDSNRLSFSYRRTRVPSSKVKSWPIDLSFIKLGKPAFDYVIFSNGAQREIALKMAKIGVVDVANKEVIRKNRNVVHNTEKSVSISKTTRISADNQEVESVILRSGELFSGPTNTSDLSSSQPMVGLE